MFVLYMYCLYYIGWSNSSTCNDDIDECSTDTAACNNQGNCTNTEGSFICTCNQYWTGDGEYLSQVVLVCEVRLHRLMAKLCGNLI